MYDKGIVLVGTGERYIGEIQRLIPNIKQYYPDMHIAVYADACLACDLDLFYPIETPAYGFEDKIRYMSSAPFEKCLFLDTDVYLTSKIDDLFTMLDRFELVAPYAPIDERRLGIPDSFPELNTGVISFRNTARIKAFFRQWERLYASDIAQNDPVCKPPDQPSFREALYRSDLSFAMVSQEYNCMLDYPNFLSGKVHIVHGRRHDKEKMSILVNAYQGNRSYIPNVGLVYENEGLVIIRPVNCESGLL